MRGSALASDAVALYDEGVSLLTRHMGVVRAERFLSAVSEASFDYTKWHQRMADRMTREEFSGVVEAAERAAPYAGDPATVI